MKNLIIVQLLFFAACYTSFAKNDNQKNKKSSKNSSLIVNGERVSFNLNNLNENKLREAAKSFVFSYYKDNPEKRKILLKVLESENVKINLDSDDNGNIIFNIVK
jgi:hypothetical protein